MLIFDRSVADRYPDSALSVMFSDRHQVEKVDGAIVIEREYKFFSLLVFYLENLREIPVFNNEVDNALFK